jgi:16S rRNA (guanine966-N2)-methyltransferase
MSKTGSPQRPGSLRIIGGRWRGRRIVLPPHADIRPTPDRVRETLFNWLAPVIDGMRCLDLFAGSGALGLEALSRGASESWFVENSKASAAQLSDTLRELECRSAKVVTGDALGFLQQQQGHFDLVFLDPPFDGIDLGNLCTLLEAGWLAPVAYIYLETSRKNSLPAMPATWSTVREKTAGQVRFALAKRTLTTRDSPDGPGESARETQLSRVRGG